ncbi:MAG: polysaccharide biosynthesis tyrosine autokinase [Verrucomicrobia bacterium]|nr:polysaccharide biosynthesis tyrosine autokinase [Verrucomicrobiota bacterium]MCH8512959.1 polysaccharide biosynthesis tyrosine autokinase [Kiritimatiellia bacterium]
MDQNNNQTDSTNLHFLDYWRVVRSRKEIILAVIVLVVLVGGFVTTLMPERYMATSRIRVQQDSPTVQSFGANSAMGQQYNPYFLLTELEILQSDLILGEVVDVANLTRIWGQKYTRDNVDLPRETVMEMLKRRVRVQQQRNTSNIDITVVADDPSEAAFLANQIAESYRQHRVSSKVRDVRRGIAALEEALAEKGREVEEAEDELERVRDELGLTAIGMMGTRITAETERVRQLQADLMAFRVDMLTREARLNELEKLEGEGLVNALLMSVPDRSLEVLRGQLIDAEIQLRMLLENLGTNHPDVRRVRAGLEETRDRMEAAINGIKAGLRSDYVVSRSKVEALQTELNLVEQAERNAQTMKVLPFERAERRLREKRAIHAALNARVAQEGVDISLPRNPVEVFEPAKPPERPFSPRWVLNMALSVFVGSVFGVGLAFFIEYLDTSVKTVDDVERHLNSPVIGVIPQKVKPLNQEGPESPHAESYRVLRTNLQFANKGHTGGAFAICSGGVGEGKSTTLFNLAYVCASMGDRVLIVDSDMRRPVQHTILGISNSTGLTNVLLRDLPVEDAIKTTNLPNLHFLPSGRLPRTSVGLLDTQRIRDLIKNLKARYDYVFFDSPPIMGVSDSSILASEVDGVLLVVQYRKYPRQMSSRAKRLIENVGGTLVGVVLNNINILRDDSYYYYSSYYSHYASTSDEEISADEQSGPAQERF